MTVPRDIQVPQALEVELSMQGFHLEVDESNWDGTEIHVYEGDDESTQWPLGKVAARRLKDGSLGFYAYSGKMRTVYGDPKNLGIRSSIEAAVRLVIKASTEEKR